MITLFFAFFTLQVPAPVFAGKVLDEKVQPLPNAVIQIFQNGVLKGGNATDFDGYYRIKLPEPGCYHLVTFYSGYDSLVIKDICLKRGDELTHNLRLNYCPAIQEPQPPMNHSPKCILCPIY
jgi:hypothetical protein